MISFLLQISLLVLGLLPNDTNAATSAGAGASADIKVVVTTILTVASFANAIVFSIPNKNHM